MFCITDTKFPSPNYGDDAKFINWPMLYILENGKKAYVGESNRVIARMSEHLSKEEKKIFENVHLIYSQEFNQSVTYDFENRLIEFLIADEKYILTNKNKGFANKDYYKRPYYDNLFPVLWEQLRDKKIATKHFDQIQNSDLFKYSPYKALNESQFNAVEAIIKYIEKDYERPIIVEGMPGSGKTIVAVYLFKYLKDYEDEQGNPIYKDKKMAIVVPQTSLRKTLKSLFKQIDGLMAKDVISPSAVATTKYDILLVDEAHRLRRRKNIANMGAHGENNRRLNLSKDATELDWILTQCKCPILFFDSDQVIGPSGVSAELMDEKLDERFQKRMIAYYKLSSQMRMIGGNGYIDYLKELLYSKPDKKQIFGKYEFKIVDSFSEFEKLLRKKEEEYELCRMVAGYAWPWVSKKNKQLKDIKIENSERMWNNRTDNWVHCENAINEVGCIHSVQGYDLNYGFVILGEDIRYDKVKGAVVADKSQYYDMNGKRTATDEELNQYIKNIYYVLMTRGIRGTYLYVCDQGLKEYLEQYIEEYHE